MPVYKLCMKILKRNIPSLMIYLIVFLSVSTIINAATANTIRKETAFSQRKTNIAFVSQEESVLIEGLKNELGKVANFVDIPQDDEALKDALFFRRIEYILRIPEGFTRKFMNGEEALLVKTMVPASATNVYIDLSVEKYLNTAKLYINNTDSITQEELVSSLKKNLAMETKVEITADSNVSANIANYSFNYMAYSLLSILILGMSLLMISLNDLDIKRRVSCSPVSETKINLQSILANLTFAFTSWLILVITCLLLDVKNIATLNNVYFILNSLIFAFCSTGMGFLIGSIVKKQEAISAITNVVVLGSCFLSGVFVPAEFLGDTLKYARFLPTYWFVNANNNIAKLTQFDFSHLKPVLSDMAILFCFALAFFALALVIRKKNRYS